MATSTYTELRKTVVGAATSSITLDLTGISGYTDLVLVADNVGSSASIVDLGLRFNNDTSSLYSETDLYGAGNTGGALSSRAPRTYVKLSYSGGSDKPMLIANIMNYSSTSVFKTVLIRDNTATNAVRAAASLWRSTAAITSMTILYTSGNIAAGATFSLYGIAATSVGAKATGGTIYSDASYYYHVFNASGAFTPNQALTADILTIAGGGGTATVASGGGGAGGLLYNANTSLSSGVNYTCTVGAGGAAAGTDQRSGATNGVNSSFAGSGLTTITASGGGFGIGFPSPEVATFGGNGGSGGGSTGPGGGTAGTGIAGPPRQGYNGGVGTPTSGAGNGGGGGGAGGVGASGSTGIPGAGGIGLSAYSSWGITTGAGENVNGTYYFAGGGGGAGYNISNSNSIGGFGGGGSGISGLSGANGTPGKPNTGGGAGGSGGFSTAVGAAGGSGIIIVRYAK